MKIKITLSYHFTIKLAKIQKLDNILCSRSYGRKALSYNTRVMQNDTTLMERNLTVSNKSANTFTFQSNDPISTIFTKKLYINNMRLFIATLFAIENSKSPNIEWINYGTKMHWNIMQQWKEIRRISMNWYAVIFISVQKCVYNILPLSKKEGKAGNV